MSIVSPFGRAPCRQLAPAVVLAALSLLWATHAQAAELRCTALGANCICSEPLNTPSIVRNGDFWNPADSATMECKAEAGAPAGGAVVRTSNTITASADATALAALPAGSTVLNFVRADDNHNGTFFVGNGGPVNASFARLAARWYIWHTPAFDFKLEGACNNSKIAQFDKGALVDFTGQFHTYNYLTFSPAVDCCVSGPGPNSAVPSSQMKGKWWRFEIVLTNRSGPAFDIKMYGKNVTDNGPELLLIDLNRNSAVNNLTPPSLMSTILSNNHRDGTCRGWIGISHYMMAGWTTNAGQRIGAAIEVEPGAVGQPTNINVSQLGEE